MWAYIDLPCPVIDSLVHVIVKPVHVRTVFELHKTIFFAIWNMGSHFKISLFSLFVIVLANVALAINHDLIVKNADRTIDVTSQLVKITHRLTLSNTGKNAATSFVFPITAKSKSNLSFFKAQVSQIFPYLVSNLSSDYSFLLSS